MRPGKYKVISLFSGAMGLEIGLERSGLFKTMAAIELESRFCETIQRNREAGRLGNRHMAIICADIRDLDPLALLKQLKKKPGELDVIAGGPPCQAFSVFGRRRGLEDTRGQLVFEFVRFVKAIRPRAFLMENVRGLMSMSFNPSGPKGSLFQAIQRSFNDIGYRTDTFLVNSANYGAPQIRERMIMIGTGVNMLADFPHPTHSDRPKDRLKPFATLGDAIRGKLDPDPAIMDFSARKKRYLAMVPPGGNWRSLPAEIQKESMGKSFYLKGGRSAYWRKLSYEYPCPTVVTMPNHAGTSMCHPDELRPLTVGECALVQGFPPQWEFVGSPSGKYVQVGNAVPVVLGEVAAQALVQLFERMGPMKPRRGARSLLPDRVLHLRPHVRTRWWWKDGKVINGLPYSQRPKDQREQKDSQLPLFPFAQ